jgi:hypothetical protein
MLTGVGRSESARREETIKIPQCPFGLFIVQYTLYDRQLKPAETSI